MTITDVDLIFGVLIAWVVLSAIYLGWTAGRHWERKIWRSGWHIAHQIAESRKARAGTEVKELRVHLPVVKVGADFNDAGTRSSRMSGSQEK